MNASANAVSSDVKRSEPLFLNVVTNMLCHVAMCSNGFMLHTTACPVMRRQLVVVMLSLSPILMAEGNTPKILRAKKAASPSVSNTLLIVEKQEFIAKQYSRNYLQRKLSRRGIGEISYELMCPDWLVISNSVGTYVSRVSK